MTSVETLTLALALDLSGTGKKAGTGHFHLGTAVRPDRQEVSVNSVSLLRNGQPWMPVMGEFHFSRYPAQEWGDELEKMKAGGIDIVASYVFWIHHEEIEGTFDWTGQRNLREFVKRCQDLGLPVIIRCGPWCHGEVRNGGLPDWLLRKGFETRADDPGYLAAVRILYGEIGQQLKGLLWKDGGPVIGIQIENEYGGPAAHLLTLKRLAREAGLDVPLYTRTGWPELATPILFGELLPLYGAYAEGFWDRELTPMPGQYWRAFIFTPERTDAAVATDQLGQRDGRDGADAALYPYLTCELGGGMASSYHRRIRINPDDIESVALCKLGSGSNLLGYYMYHGGTNPDGRLSTLQESQATAYWNDLPVKSYDFQAPLGEFGQKRPHYYSLDRLHGFLHAYGARLANMPATFPSGDQPLRWSVRSDGRSGFVFVNNHQRLKFMPARPGVQFTLTLAGGTLRFPEQPVTVPAGGRFIWPFNLDCGEGVKLTYATAQPVGLGVFALTPGVPAEFVFESGERFRFEKGPAKFKVKNVQFTLVGEEVCPAEKTVAVTLEPVKVAVPAREIRAGSHGVAEAPTDADFESAAVWRLKLPAGLDQRNDLLLRIRYIGDVARIDLDGRLLTDNFYNGNVFEIGLRRYAPDIYRKELLLKVLPLRKDAPIYLPDDAWPEFGAAGCRVEVTGAWIVEQERRL